MTEDYCDLCGPPYYRVLEAARPYIGENEPPVICHGCGLVYVRQRRSPEEIARSWDDLWLETYTSEWPGVRARLYYVAEFCDQRFGWAGKSVLDIGAGEGTFLGFVRARGDHPVGLEPNPRNQRKIRHQDMECLPGTIESVQVPGKYDVITILWTLENCGDCIGMLRKARECLSPGGRIVVATGSRILVPFKKPLGSYFSKNPADTHCFRWSANTLARAMRKAGFNGLAFNDYEVSDVLLAVAVAAPGPGTISFGKDNPADVEFFFNKWKMMFP